MLGYARTSLSSSEIQPASWALDLQEAGVCTYTMVLSSAFICIYTMNVRLYLYTAMPSSWSAELVHRYKSRSFYHNAASKTGGVMTTTTTLIAPCARVIHLLNYAVQNPMNIRQTTHRRLHEYAECTKYVC